MSPVGKSNVAEALRQPKAVAGRQAASGINEPIYANVCIRRMVLRLPALVKAFFSTTGITPISGGESSYEERGKAAHSIAPPGHPCDSSR
jgi:hypothetical protein